MSANTKKFTYEASTRAIAKIFSLDTADVHFVFSAHEDNKNEPNLKVAAHKTLLSALSPVFDAMFSGNWKESTSVDIVDSSPDAFNDFLQYFYANNIILNENNVCHILKLANKYNIPELISSCSSFFTSYGTLELAVHLFVLAHQMDLHELKSKCGKIIRNNTSSVLKSSVFFLCDKDALLEILSIKSLKCAEEEKFDACIEWARAECEQQDLESNGENMRNVLGACFDRIRFKEMNPKVFYDRLERYEEMFTRKEVVEIVIKLANDDLTLLSHVYEFEESGQDRVDSNGRLSLSCRMELKAFNLPFDSSSRHAEIDDKFTGAVHVGQFSSESPGDVDALKYTTHQYMRAKKLDTNKPYGFYLKKPAVLSPQFVYSIKLDVHQAKFPVTFRVSTKELNEVTLSAFECRSNMFGECVGLNDDYITYFAALHFQECTDTV